MVTAWRIVKARYASIAFDGEGARRAGARWTSIGRKAVYVSSTVALATLEIVVHLDSTSPLFAYSLIQVGIPEPLITTVELATLPRNWRRYPAPPELRRIGDEWLGSRRSAALRVPSALVAVEYNYVLNPQHPDFPLITIGTPQSFPIDPRLL